MAPFALALLLAAAAAERPVAFDAPGWTLRGDAKVETYLGRTALRIRRGEAVFEGISFRDGTIEYDVAVTTHRSFHFIEVRATARGESEEFYLRAHKSELPDALQYTPVWKGSSAWQLFHGPGYTAIAAFPREQWFHVKLVLSGTRAAMFVGDAAAPQLVVPRLRRDPVAGWIEFGGNCPPGGAPEGLFTTSFSNLVVRPGEVAYAFPPAPAETSPPGVVSEWQISETYLPERGPARELPKAALGGLWKKVPAEPSGLVTLDKWAARPETAPRVALVARIFVRAAEKGTRTLRLGYSDEVTAFVNGKPLFSADARYSFDNPRQEGLIGLNQATLYVPLEKGDNEIDLVIADSFGGWGVMGQFEDPSGLTVTAGPAK